MADNKLNAEGKSVLQLAFDHATHRLEVVGNIGSLDIALNMLDMAKREFEARWKDARGGNESRIALPPGLSLIGRKPQ